MANVNYRDFWLKFIDLSDRVLPALTSAESLVLVHLFARTMAVGESTCRISYSDLCLLTNLAVGTVKTAINGLIHKGILEVVSQSGPRVARIYKLYFPHEIKKVSKLQRDPRTLVSSIEEDERAYEGIVDRLDRADRESLNLILRTLSLEKQARLRESAYKSAKDGEDIEKKYLELVILSEFGPRRLAKYANS